MWLMVCFIVSAVVFVFLTVWHVHAKMDSQYDFLRDEIEKWRSNHGARLACLEMTAPGSRERLDALEVFFDLERKYEPVGDPKDWLYRLVYEKINRCKKCGGRT